ncbi:MAG: fasciclin domain-containing protein [Candidatus Methylacidiphilales bacterium]
MKTNIFKTALLGLTFGAVLLSSCKKDEDKTTPTPITPAAKSIYEIAKADTTFTILVAALDKTGLKETLSNAGTYTVFAPNNTAFRKEGVSVEFINAITDPDLILEIKNALLYHVLGLKVKSTEVPNAYVGTLYLVNGNGVSLRTANNPVKLNNEANVVVADIAASNGIIHVIDAPLNPQTVVDIAVNNPAFTSLVGALEKAELVNTLEDAPALTVFAPTNDAFSAINFKLEDFTKEQLTPILTSHVLGTQVRSSQIKNGNKATTLNTNTELTFNTTTGVKFNGGSVTDITVTTADIQATNGVVHVINKVVLPLR